MRILLVSDSHSDCETLDDIIRHWPDVDLYLHAGDAETHPNSIYPFRIVRGNCDFSFDMDDELIVPTPFGNLLMRHKEETLTQKYIEDHNIKVFVYGHRHVKECKKKNGIAYINPGAISMARDGEESYALLENESDNVYVTFYRIGDHKIIKKFLVYMGREKKSV